MGRGASFIMSSEEDTNLQVSVSSDAHMEEGTPTPALGFDNITKADEPVTRRKSLLKTGVAHPMTKVSGQTTSDSFAETIGLMSHKHSDEMYNFFICIITSPDMRERVFSICLMLIQIPLLITIICKTNTTMYLVRIGKICEGGGTDDCK